MRVRAAMVRRGRSLFKEGHKHVKLLSVCVSASGSEMDGWALSSRVWIAAGPGFYTRGRDTAPGLTFTQVMCRISKIDVCLIPLCVTVTHRPS